MIEKIKTALQKEQGYTKKHISEMVQRLKKALAQVYYT